MDGPHFNDFEALVADVLGSGLDAPLTTSSAKQETVQPPRSHSLRLPPALFRGHDSKASTRPPSAQVLWHDELFDPTQTRTNTPTALDKHQRIETPSATIKKAKPAKPPGTIPSTSASSGSRRVSMSSGSHTGLEASAATEDSAIPEWQAQFFKTKMCPYYLEGGGCSSGPGCRFAHTLDELRPLPDLRKTKLCSSYTKRVACRNPECPFAHQPDELRTSSSIFYKVTLCNFYKNSKCWNGPNCRFAHGIEELRGATIPLGRITGGTRCAAGAVMQGQIPDVHVSAAHRTSAAVGSLSMATLDKRRGGQQQSRLSPGMFKAGSRENDNGAQRVNLFSALGGETIGRQSALPSRPIGKKIVDSTGGVLSTVPTIVGGGQRRKFGKHPSSGEFQSVAAYLDPTTRGSPMGACPNMGSTSNDADVVLDRLIEWVRDMQTGTENNEAEDSSSLLRSLLFGGE